MMKLESLSIFFPAYNDSHTISSLVEKAEKVARKISDNFEILVVNDGSTDKTHDLLEQLKKKYSCLKVIHHRNNKGYGGALISGFKNSKKDWIFYTDGDGQYDVRELTKLVKKVNDKIDVVNGFKIERSDSFVRKIIGNTNNFILHLLFTLPISDIDCDFRLIRKSMLDKIKLSKTSGAICTELIVTLHEAGAQFTEIGVRHYERKYGNSQFFKPKHVFQTVIDHIAFYFSRLKARRRFTRSSTGG